MLPDDMRDRLMHARRRRPDRLLALYHRQCGFCTWCINPITADELLKATIDHIIPRSHGGPWVYSNMQLLHEQCNYDKADWCPGCDFCEPERGSSEALRDQA